MTNTAYHVYAQDIPQNGRSRSSSNKLINNAGDPSIDVSVIDGAKLVTAQISELLPC